MTTPESINTTEAMRGSIYWYLEREEQLKIRRPYWSRAAKSCRSSQEESFVAYGSPCLALVSVNGGASRISWDFPMCIHLRALPVFAGEVKRASDVCIVAGVLVDENPKDQSSQRSSKTVAS